VRSFALFLGLIVVLTSGCNQISQVEEINWHEQGMQDSSAFVFASMSMPGAGTYPITAYIQDGYVKFQGDILLSETSPHAQATYVSNLWDNNTIPFSIHPDISKRVKKHILKAVKTYNKETTLKWIARSTETDYVEFSPSSGCASFVGRKGGRQPILLADYCSYSAVLHEMGHALGFQHEQTRPDRNKAVTIHWENIPTLWQSQYKIIEDSRAFRRYDYYSIMHYPAYFGRKLVIEPKLEHIRPKDMGYRETFSTRDLLGIHFLYPAKQ
jgi:hypothetical protein